MKGTIARTRFRLHPNGVRDVRGCPALCFGVCAAAAIAVHARANPAACTPCAQQRRRDSAADHGGCHSCRPRARRPRDRGRVTPDGLLRGPATGERLLTRRPPSSMRNGGSRPEPLDARSDGQLASAKSPRRRASSGALTTVGRPCFHEDLRGAFHDMEDIDGRRGRRVRASLRGHRNDSSPRGGG